MSLRDRTAKRLSVTNVAGPLFARFVVIVPNINIFWSFKKTSVKERKKLKFGGTFFQTKLLSRLSGLPYSFLSRSLIWGQRMWGQQILNGARVATIVVSLALSNYLAFVTS